MNEKKNPGAKESSLMDFSRPDATSLHLLPVRISQWRMWKMNRSNVRCSDHSDASLFVMSRKASHSAAVADCTLIQNK